MPWMDVLYRTYEANAEMAGKSDERVQLSLVAHMIANAQIEVTVDIDGNFIQASEVDKENRKTIIPVTESSASRANGIAPHALCDTLSYISADYAQYLSEEKAAKKALDKFEQYIIGLEAWRNSEYCHQKVNSIYLYLQKKCMTDDLIKSGILECTEDGLLADKKVSGIEYEKAIVRFRVQETRPDATWQDVTLFDCYTHFYIASQGGERDICYLTGREDSISTNHPKGILASNYGAKLISANDSSNFVFRGRFTNSEQACAIGYEGTQKAHSALTWLAARQGVFFGSKEKRTYVCWNPSGKKVVDLSNPLGIEDDDEPKSNTEEQYKYRLIDTLNGYRGKLDDNDNIVIMGLDAATTGRLSITYYNELRASDFYDRLQNWGETCYWYFTRFTPEKKPYLQIQTPLTKNIVTYAYGTERGNYIETDDKVMKEQSQRILHCMLDSKPIPWDIVHALTIRASNPQAYSRGNHERILSTACAMIFKFHQSKGGKIKMTLDYENKDRSYLFGRLLAVIEKAERSTFSRDEDREPNAIRLQSAYVNHPLSTWQILEGQLNPYFQRMNAGSRIFYKNIISEIVEKICQADQDKLNRPLSETYLIGYYLQRSALNWKETSVDTKEEEL